MMHDSLKLLGLGLVVAIAGGCPADDSDESGSETMSMSDTEPTTSETTPSTTDPTMGSETMPTSTDPTTSETEDPDSSGTDTSEPGACLGVPDSGAAEGDACTANGDCESGICLLFQDVPADDDAVCGAVTEDCSTRITGTLFDFATLAPLADVDVNVVKALDALTNPSGATPVAAATAGADGTFDVESDGAISAPIAIIGIAGGGDYFLTATGISSEVDAGTYEVGTGIHEFWAIPSAKLTAWSDAVDGDPDLDESVLPLGAAGGIVGFVRDADGNPVSGATVAPAADGSAAIIRYPQADDSVGSDMTDDTGLFVVFGGAATGEDYVATSGGMTGNGTAGTTKNVVFSLVLTVQ